MHLHSHWHPAFCISDPWILGLVGPWGNTGIISLFCCQHSSVHTPSRFTLIVNLSLTIAIALHCMILHVRSLTIFCSRPTETLLGILFQSSTSFPSSSHCLFTTTLPLTRPILPIHCLPTLAFLFYTFSLPPFAIKSPELLPSNFLVGPCMQRRTPRPLDLLT